MTNYNSKILFRKREKQRSAAQLVCNMSGYIMKSRPGEVNALLYQYCKLRYERTLSPISHDIFLTISLLVTRSLFTQLKAMKLIICR